VAADVAQQAATVRQRAGDLGYCSRYSDLLPAGLSGFRTPVGETDFLFSTSVRTGVGAQPVPCAVGTGAVSKG
jgi:hypothetical protein